MQSVIVISQSTKLVIVRTFMKLEFYKFFFKIKGHGNPCYKHHSLDFLEKVKELN